MCTLQWQTLLPPLAYIVPSLHSAAISVFACYALRVPAAEVCSMTLPACKKAVMSRTCFASFLREIWRQSRLKRASGRRQSAKRGRKKSASRLKKRQLLPRQDLFYKVACMLCCYTLCIAWSLWHLLDLCKQGVIAPSSYLTLTSMYSCIQVCTWLALRHQVAASTALFTGATLEALCITNTFSVCKCVCNYAILVSTVVDVNSTVSCTTIPVRCHWPFA